MRVTSGSDVAALGGLLETSAYTSEQSHGGPPVLIALDHITCMEEDAHRCSAVKTVRSIERTGYVL